jgi:GT2 family glycosyltransferase
MQQPSVSIIILNWNGLGDTIECLESLKKITYSNYKIIVVDNGSYGDDARILKEKYGDFIHVIKNDRNYGYTGGNNIGITYAQLHQVPDYYLIMNNDIVVAPDFLDTMVLAAEADHSIGIVGPRVYYRAQPSLIQSAGGGINMWTGRMSFIGARQVDTEQHNQQQERKIVSGCCFLIKKEVVEDIGMFDEAYFCYWEDVDFCLRALKHGYKVIYEPSARVWHASPLRMKLWQRIKGDTKAGGFIYYYTVRNNFRFMKNHASRTQYFAFIACYLFYRAWFMIAVSILYHRSPSRIMGVCRGLWDGLLGRNDWTRLYRTG